MDRLGWIVTGLLVIGFFAGIILSVINMIIRAWSWIWVISPMWIAVIIVFIIIGITAVRYLIVARREHENNK